MTEHLPECPQGYAVPFTIDRCNCNELRAREEQSGGLITRQRAEQIGRNIGKYGCVITEQQHLPECQRAYRDHLHRCICKYVFRCEQRMREGWYEVQSGTWEQGFRYALDAAREAVAALPLTGGWTTPDGVIEEIDKAKTVAAIDALRKEN